MSTAVLTRPRCSQKPDASEFHRIVEARIERTRRYDLLRTELKGGKVVFKPSALELDPWLRGRLVLRIAMEEITDPESDHDEGVVVFAGLRCVWTIRELNGTLTMEISVLEG